MFIKQPKTHVRKYNTKEVGPPTKRSCSGAILPSGRSPFKSDPAELRDVKQGVALVAVVAQRSREPLCATCRLPDGDLIQADHQSLNVQCAKNSRIVRIGVEMLRLGEDGGHKISKVLGESAQAAKRTGNTRPTVRLMHQEEKSDPASFTFMGRDRLYVAYASGIDSCGNCMIRLLGHEKHPVQRSSHREKTRRDA